MSASATIGLSVPRKRKHDSEQGESADKGDKKATRAGRPIMAWVHESIGEAMDDFRNAQRIKPSITDVVELALQEFFTREGVWPRKKKQ